MAYAENQITLEVVSDGEAGSPGPAGADGKMLYATCSTASDQTAKVATLSAGTLTLETGATVAVTFENQNTAQSPTLNVNGTGAKSIIAIGENLTENSGLNWVENATAIFIYDGTYWQMDGTSSLYRADEAKKTADNATVDIADLELFINGGYTTEITSPYDNLSCDKEAFYDKVSGQYGTYTFTYNGSAWTIDGSTVDLQDYGINLQDDASANDTITVNLESVEGSMQTINNQYAELSDRVDENAETASSDLQSAQQELQDAINDTKNGLLIAQTAIDMVSTKTQSMGFSSDYGLVLYGQDATDNTGFKLQLAAQAINFINGALGRNADILAYISGNSLNINNAAIRSQLRFGNFAFIPRSNGNMALKYLG